MAVEIKNNLVFAEFHYKEIGSTDIIFDLELMAYVEGQRAAIFSTEVIRKDSVVVNASETVTLVQAYLLEHFGEKKALLAGNSIHAVKEFFEEIHQQTNTNYYQHLQHRTLNIGSLYVFLKQAGVLTEKEVNVFRRKESAGRNSEEVGSRVVAYATVYEELLTIITEKDPSTFAKVDWKALVLDSETGGLNPELHSLLEFTFMVFDAGKIVDTLYVAISEKEYRTTPKALEINGIDLNQLAQEGITRQEASLKLDAFLRKNYPQSEDKPFLLGHNVNFDYRFIAQLCIECQTSLFAMTIASPFIDTMSVILFLHDANFLPEMACSSQGAFNYFGIKIEDRHRSTGDCEGTVHLYNHLLHVIR